MYHSSVRASGSPCSKDHDQAYEGSPRSLRSDIRRLTAVVAAAERHGSRLIAYCVFAVKKSLAFIRCESVSFT